MSESPTETLTESSSIQPVRVVDSYFHTTPRAFRGDQYFVARPLNLELRHTPLDADNDRAGLIPAALECSATAQLLPLTFIGRRRDGVLTHNWTVTVAATGVYKLCFFNARESKWYVIARPGNLTFVPYYVPASLNVAPPVIGEAIFLSATIFGVDTTRDVIRVIRWGAPGGCGAAAGFLRFPMFEYSPQTGFFRGNSSTLLVASGFYAFCYVGYPYLGFNTLLNPHAPIALQARVTRVVVVSGNPLRILRPLTLAVLGDGLSARDELFLTTAADCASPGLVTRARLLRNVDGVVEGRVEIRATVDVEANGTLTLCFRSNVSRAFAAVSTFDVAPIVATSIVPLGVEYARGSDAIITVRGDGINSAFDTVIFVPITGPAANTSQGLCSGTGAVSTTIYRNSVNQFMGRVRVEGIYVVCHRTNRTAFTVAGNFSVAPRFYVYNASAYQEPFYRGVELGRNFRIEVVGFELYPATDPAFMVRYNATATESPCATASRESAPRPIARFANRTLVFGTQFRGYWLVCWNTWTGAILESEPFAVFSEPPSSFTPRMIRVGTPTPLTFAGGDDMDLVAGDRDAITVCGAPAAGPNASSSISSSAVVPIAPRVANVTVPVLGNATLCFVSGVVSPANPVPFVVPLPDALQVSPFVARTEFSPSTILAGGRIVVTLIGAGLTLMDTLYICDPANRFAAAPVVANSTSITLFQINETMWNVDILSSGTFELCYQHSVAPSFPPGPIGATITVDAPVFSFFPATITATVEAALNFTGIDLHQVVRVFVRTNASSCGDRPSPFDVSMTKRANNSYSVVVSRRGTFPVCFQGASGAIYGIGGDRLTVQPFVANFSVRQDGVPTSNWTAATFFDSYPMDITVSGGALKYNEDVFYAVLGSSCEVVNPPRLSSRSPPSGDVNAMTLQLTVPNAGEWRLCHKLQGAVTGTMVPNLVIIVVSSLVLLNQTLIVRGPVVAPDVFYSFAFTVERAELSPRYTALQRPTPSSSITLTFVPVGVLRFRCQLLNQGGATLRTLTVDHTHTADLTICRTMPQSLRNADPVKQFAESVIALHNHNSLRCVDEMRDEPAAPTTTALASEVMSLVKASQELVTDPTFTFDTIAGAVNAAPIGQPTGGSFEDAQNLLDMGNEVLSRPASQLDQKTVEAHVKLTNAVVLVALTRGPDEPVTAQKIGTEVIARLGKVAGQFCSSPIADQVRQINVTSGEISVTIRRDDIAPANLSPLLEAGFGMSTSPTFAPTVRGSKCLQAVGARQNFMPQIDGTGSSRRNRRFDAQQGEPTTPAPQAQPLPEFNMPLFTFALPADPTPNPLTQTNNITFRVLYPPVTRRPGEVGSGATVEAEIYRFVPVSTNQGWWQRELNVDVSADEVESVLSVTFNTSAAYRRNSMVAQPNFVLLSGTYRVVPIVIPPQVREKDYWLLIYILALAALHIVLCLIARIVDRRTDARRDPDIEAVLLFSALTLHRWVRMGTRKPHHPIRTWRRVTTTFTFLFAASFFTVYTIDDGESGRPFYLNIAYACGVVGLATPVAAVARIGLFVQSRDYAGGIAAALAIVAAAVTIPVAGAIVAMIVVSVVGVIAFLVATLLFRARSSMLLQPEESKFPLVFGSLVHIAVEVTAIGLCLWVSLVRGTRIDSNDGRFDYFQVVAWVIFVDAVLVEPAKNWLIIAFWGGSVRADAFLDKRKEALRRKKLRELAARAASPPGAHGISYEHDEDEEDGEDGQLPAKFVVETNPAKRSAASVAPANDAGSSNLPPTSALYAMNNYDTDLDEIDDLDDIDAVFDNADSGVVSVVEVAPSADVTPSAFGGGGGGMHGSRRLARGAATASDASGLDEVDAMSNFSLEDPWGDDDGVGQPSAPVDTLDNSATALSEMSEGGSGSGTDSESDAGASPSVSRRDPFASANRAGEDPYDVFTADLDTNAAATAAAAASTTNGRRAAASVSTTRR